MKAINNVANNLWWLNVGYENSKEVGHYFDLDETTKAYELGSKKVSWLDYSNDEDWDMESYYNEFDNWWDSLSEMKRVEILNNFN